MYSRPIGAMNNWNQDYQVAGYGNYGYGIYSQDIELHRNPYTGRLHSDRDIDFVPLGYSSFSPYATFPAGYHQHYHN